MTLTLQMGGDACNTAYEIRVKPDEMRWICRMGEQYRWLPRTLVALPSSSVADQLARGVWLCVTHKCALLCISTIPSHQRSRGQSWRRQSRPPGGTGR